MSITYPDGTVAFDASYDAWGKQTVTNNTFKYHRGYTGHEHLPEFSLINMNGWNQIGSMAINAVANQIIPPMNIPIGDHFGLSVSPAFGLGSNGLTGGLNFTGTYTNGDFSISGGYGFSNQGYSLYGGLTYYDRKNEQYFSGYTTYFGGGKDNQRVGGLGYKKGDFSLRIENDMKMFGLGDGHDRWRTSAVEMSIGDFFIGSIIYTNQPYKVDAEGNRIYNSDKTFNPSFFKGLFKRETISNYKNGIVYSAPLYIGTKRGNVSFAKKS